MSDVPQESILTPVLFHGFINNLQSSEKCTVNSFAGDAKIGWTTIQKDIGWRNGPAGILWNAIRTNVRSCIWEGIQGGEQLCWKASGGPGRQQAECAAWCVAVLSKAGLGVSQAVVTWKITASRLRKVIITLITLHLECCIQIWVL